MKTTLNTLLATLAISLTAAAAPALLVETTFAEHHATVGKDVLTTHLTVESGRQAVIQIGRHEYTVTPTLLDDGTVAISATVTEGGDKKADKLVVPTLRTQLGNVAEIHLGELAWTIKTSLAK